MFARVQALRNLGTISRAFNSLVSLLCKDLEPEAVELFVTADQGTGYFTALTHTHTHTHTDTHTHSHTQTHTQTQAMHARALLDLLALCAVTLL